MPALMVTGSESLMSRFSMVLSTLLSLKLTTTTFCSNSPRVRPMRCWVSSLIYSQMLSSNVSRAVGEPITAVTSALVEVPGTSSFSDSGSTLLPRTCGGGINQPQEDSSKQPISMRLRGEAGRVGPDRVGIDRVGIDRVDVDRVGVDIGN